MGMITATSVPVIIPPAIAKITIRSWVARIVTPRQVSIAAAPATVRKARVGLLILYILFAVPLGLIGMVLLLALTFLVLGAAVITAAAGIMLITASFGGFTVFADILVVAGVAIIVLALGLLLLWLFVWLIGGAMVGLIRGLIGLGGKWCYKEVAAA